MNYIEAVNYIHSIPKFVRPLGNADLERLLSVLGNPHEGGGFIHVAGTNGKGSVSAMLSSILTAVGYRTGMFTSPFIEVFNERIQINNKNISDVDLADVASRVRTAMEDNGFSVSEFAFITAMAFLYFKEQKCDFVVLETGLGGRLDATNVVKAPLLSVITAIGYDHMQFFGNSLEEIAYEKCGIIKDGCPVVSQKNPVVRDLILGEAEKMHSTVVFSETPEKTENGFLYNGREYPLGLRGEYQLANAAEAVEAALSLRRSGIKITDEALCNGLKNVKWPVRFEYVRDNVIIDGGHNIDGIKALKHSLAALGQPYHIVMAMMEDKAVSECAAEIADGALSVTATEIAMPRCMRADALAGLCGIEKYNSDFKHAIDNAIDTAAENEIVCICGSLYFAAQAKEYLTK